MKLNAFIFCCTLPLLARADGLPDLGDVSQTSISPFQERQIGEQSMFQIRASKFYLDDPELADYLNTLGNRLVINSDEPSQPFEFFILNDSAINAFAMPGGFIGVNSGLFLTAQNESELASVLSHEIAHVTQHHLARMISGQKYDSLAAVAAVALAILAARNNPQNAVGAIAGMQGGIMQRQLNFTRTHEEEADRIGIVTLEKSGFDVRAMPSFFEHLQRATRIIDGNSPTYLRTHPITAERIADVDNRIHQIPFRLVSDNIEFQMMRARLLVIQKNPPEAIDYFNTALGEKKFGNPIAHRYGLVLALIKNQQSALARQAFEVLEKEAPQNALISTLKGKLKQSIADKEEVTTFYRNAIQLFPGYRALGYDYLNYLVAQKESQQALQFIGECLNDFPNDARLYELQARAYNTLNMPQKAHHALAYNYILRGKLQGAIEQLELAKTAGGNFQDLSTIETELKHFKELLYPKDKRN